MHTHRHRHRRKHTHAVHENENKFQQRLLILWYCLFQPNPLRVRFEAEVASTNRKNSDKPNESCTRQWTFFYQQNMLGPRCNCAFFVAVNIAAAAVDVVFLSFSPCISCSPYVHRISLSLLVAAHNLFVIFFDRLRWMYVFVWECMEMMRERERSISIKISNTLNRKQTFSKQIWKSQYVQSG